MLTMTMHALPYNIFMSDYICALYTCVFSDNTLNAAFNSFNLVTCGFI